MTTKKLLVGAAAIVALVLTPVVIGRFGDAFAVLLRGDVLLGFATVATLVAINILESNHVATSQARRIRKPRPATASAASDVANVVPMWRDEDQKAA